MKPRGKWLAVWLGLGVMLSAGAALGDASGVMPLTLGEYLRKVKENNERVLSQEQEWRISLDSLDNASAIYEAELAATYTHESLREKLTAEDISKTVWSGISERDDRNERFGLQVKNLLPTGGSLQASATMDVLSNEYNRPGPSEYKSYYGISLVQPVLKNAGVSVTRAGIDVAEADTAIAFQEYRRQLMAVAYEAGLAYWNLALNQKKHDIIRDSVAVAESIYRDNEARAAVGTLAATEVLDAKAGLFVRRAAEREAAKNVAVAMNAVRSHMSASATAGMLVVADAQQPLADGVPRRTAAHERAFANRPEYLAVRKKLSRADIRVSYAENQLWPQLDLKGSFGLNGLDYSVGHTYGDALDGDHPSWTVGAEFVLPLGGGRKTRSELSAAKKRKRQALLEMKAIEVAVVNSVDSALETLDSALAQVRYFSEATDLNRQLLDIEMDRMKSGKSSSRIVLEREEAYIRAKEAEAESLTNYRKALLGLKTAQGTLLSEHDLDVSPEEAQQ